MHDFFIALRNLSRNRRRSVSTLLALCIGCAALIIFGGYISNIKYTMQTAYIRSGGHFQIQQRDFYRFGSGNPAAFGIDNYEGLIRELLNSHDFGPRINVISPSLQFLGIGSNPSSQTSRTIIGSGVVARDVRAMREWNEYLIPQRSPEFKIKDEERNAAIVGVGLARVLDYCTALHLSGCATPQQVERKSEIKIPNDILDLAKETGRESAPLGNKQVIDLLAASGSAAPNVVQLQLSGAEDQGFKELDDALVITSLTAAQSLVYGRSKPKVTSIVVQLKRTADTDATSAAVKRYLADRFPQAKLTTRAFQELNPFYVQSIRLFDTIFIFIFTLIGAIVLFTVSNTMTAAVVERTVEIGTIRAIGLRERDVSMLFLIEGATLGVLGTVLGLIVAVILASIVNAMELTWLPPGSSEPLPLRIRILGEQGLVLLTVTMLSLIAAASAWWPARRASKLNIVEALRHA